MQEHAHIILIIECGTVYICVCVSYVTIAVTVYGSVYYIRVQCVYVYYRTIVVQCVYVHAPVSVLLPAVSGQVWMLLVENALM